VKQAILRGVELGLLYVLVTVVSPAVTTRLPTLSPVVIEIGVPLIVAIVVEVLLTSLISRPQVRVQWKSAGNPNPLPRLDMSAAQLDSGSATFELTLQGFPGSPGGWLLMRWLVARGLTVSIDAPVAPVYMTSDISRPGSGAFRAIAENSDSDGLTVALRAMPSRDLNAWVWGRMLFTALGYPTFETFEIQIRASASTTWSQKCAKVLAVQTSAHQMTIYK
jgi:hypothetical protein